MTTEFIEYLKNQGWCIYYSDTATYPRLYNIHSKVTPVITQIKNIYREYAGTANNIEKVESYVLGSLPSINGSRFNPAEGELFKCKKSGCWFANDYKSFEPLHQPLEISPFFHELFERLFNNKYERNIVLQWIAHIIQKPLERPTWHLLLTSDTGTGKGFLYSILSKIVKNAASVSNYSALFDKHSTLLESNLLILLDDTKSNHDSTMTKLKSALSEPSITVNPKFGKEYTANTYTRIILASNEKRPLRLEENERRWLGVSYMEHKIDRDETAKFITSLSDWLDKPGAIEAVYKYFASLDISSFNCKYIHQTDTLKSMIEKSKNCYEDSLIEYAKDKRVFTFEEAKNAISAAGYNVPSDPAIHHALSDNGFNKKRIRVNKAQITYWYSSDINELDIKDYV